MEYQLTITKRENNPDYMTQYVAWQERNRYRNSFEGPNDAPQPFILNETLTVTVSEETFAAIRKAAVETF